ncbi:MAG: hypothetical protein PVG03_13900 [Desulfarculaceae bacterium]|jgi:hypothetical protein
MHYSSNKFLGKGWCKGLLLVLLLAAPLAFTAGASADPIIIDHNCTDIYQIPDQYVQAVKDNVAWHYAHTSHGEQLDIGLAHLAIADGRFASVIGFGELPGDPGTLQVFDGQTWDETYITPDLYWESDYGRQLTRNVLNNNPSINVSGWAWCTQLDYYGAGEVQAYLDNMAAFEAAYPDVTFIYFTGNAQATGWEGYNRQICNNQIRDWVLNDPDANRVLFDFADLDAWWYNSGTGNWEVNTYSFNGVDVLTEHWAYQGEEEGGHTTFASCENKGRAVWWMMARIAGWNP